MSEWEKLGNLSTPLQTKSCATSQQRKIMQPLHNKIMQPLHKTLREWQNAALRTSHCLSNVSNCFFFQKYWESKRKKGVCFFGGRGCMIFLATVTAVTTVFIFYVLSTLGKSIWQPMWCSQGSVLRFLQCFHLILARNVLNTTKM